MKYYLTQRVDSLCPDIGPIIEVWKSTENPALVEYICGSDIRPLKRVDVFVSYHNMVSDIIKESDDLNLIIEQAALEII